MLYVRRNFISAATLLDREEIGRMPTYQVTIDGAYADERTREFKVDLPLDPRTAYEVGSEWPTAQAVANYYAAQCCDSGTVCVTGRGERGIVARRSFR